ncbi:MAG: pyruvate formate-lyase [Ruminococcaceae bacterium]|nr:pyruvate formate-lyase [Oscillospiraceae bacterium]
MTKNIEALLQQLKDKDYRKLRSYDAEGPILYPIDFFGFHLGKPEKLIPKEGNVTPNYSRIITKGFDAIREELVVSIQKATDPDKIAYGKRMLADLDACIRISDNYRQTVSTNPRLYHALQRVPRKGATTFYEACLFLNICIYFLRIFQASHLGLGRFDQYMYPFYLADKERGVTDEELFETLEAFFISLNFDADLYSGIQQGDNGQSIVLGGFDREGKSVYNELSDMCMEASLELNLIDPKVNLRVGKDTPIELYQKATRLTKRGLGFPQYCNDDVVIPGLIKLGYAPEDAQNYVVAACWEYIVPNCGADYPNRGTLNFPLVVSNVLKEKLADCDTFDALMVHVTKGIADACDEVVQRYYDRRQREVPLLSLFTDGCVESLTDMWLGGAKYINYGCHGAGIANATDALAAVKTCVYEQKTITAEQLLEVLEHNFEGFEPIRKMLRRCSKMGNNDPDTDGIASQLMTAFAGYMNHRPNGKGGIWRAGTGSAMEYLHSAAKCPATTDGRKAGEPYSSSFSPSLDVKPNGLLSIIQSFTRHDMTDIINGGPLTLEIHDSVLRNEIGMEKTAMLVKLFIDLGGHQLQLNSINQERLIDAQKHPENHPNLIVRVWGWSGYFNELDKEYQDHIIRRCAHIN